MELYNDCIYNILSDVKYHRVVNPIKKEYEKQLDELSSDAVKTFRNKSAFLKFRNIIVKKIGMSII